MRHLLVVCLLGAGLALAGCSDSTGPVSGPSDQSDISKAEQSATADVTNSYIVILSSEHPRDIHANAARLENEMAALHSRAFFQVTHRYSACMRGFAAVMNEQAAAALARNPNVERVEPDLIATIDGQNVPAGINRIDADISSTLAGNGSGAVSGVQIYIIDSGVNAHADLNRAGGSNFVPNTTGIDDLNGHGTHVAGTAAAIDNDAYVVGVAPGAPVYSVRVLNNQGSGQFSWIIAGVDWVTAQKNANPTVPMVANMSLGARVGTTAYNSLDIAVRNSINAGVVYAIAAGNSKADAAKFSPAHVTEAITVGSYNPANNKFSSFSNYGSIVDINAPGEYILSTYGTTGTATMSGTSMASPHVAGAAALYLSGHSASPAAVRNALVAEAAVVRSANPPITNVRSNTTNRSLYVANF